MTVSTPSFPIIFTVVYGDTTAQISCSQLQFGFLAFIVSKLPSESADSMHYLFSHKEIAKSTGKQYTHHDFQRIAHLGLSIRQVEVANQSRTVCLFQSIKCDRGKKIEVELTKSTLPYLSLLSAKF